MVFNNLIPLLLGMAIVPVVADGAQNPNDATGSQHVYHRPEAFINSLKNDPRAGEKIYHEFCASCHAQEPLIQLGAPRIAIDGDWKQRVAKGMDELLTTTSNGLNNMPPRGGCFECSDEQLKQAILYMLPKQAVKSFSPKK